MSWASHDPRGWDEVCLRGIKAKILKDQGLTVDLTDGEEMGIRLVLETIRDARRDSKIYEAWLLLSLWAGDEVAEAEADYLMERAGELE